MNKDCRKFYINGAWVAPKAPRDHQVINPSTEEPCGTISLGVKADVDDAVAAAKRAFQTFSQTSREDRLGLLQAIMAAYSAHLDEMAETISVEMGAPLWLSKAAQAMAPLGHLGAIMQVLSSYEFETLQGGTMFRREPIGVCGLITPWNWPVNQIACKVLPAIAAGCTMVLKPTELAPLNAHLWAQIMHEAGVPAGVFNLVDGDGPTVGTALATHPDVDMMSFTGSTRAGVQVAINAAPTVKRVTQELGGKSANIILDDADIEAAVRGGAQNVFMNSGQSCNAPTRMLVSKKNHDTAVQIAKAVADAMKVGDAMTDGTMMGPLANKTQFEKVNRLIRTGMEEGATLAAGGPGRPEGLNRGFFVRPTVFGDVKNDMTIAREEIFGPVLSVLPYESEAQAVQIANDTLYGLSGYVSSGDIEHARAIARQIRSGNVHLNGANPDFNAAFGGYKHSGNGREWGRVGFEEFTELKCVYGWTE
jgi:aldehyde dehydrogenase (NAD+)